MSRRAAIWLGTLSTVVGLATGMFTLRDQIFPPESGTAQAGPAYQQEVGRVCDRVNSDDSRRAREFKAVRRQLTEATTTIEQRNELLDSQQRANGRSGNTLALFTAVATPKDLTRTRDTAVAAWERNLSRLREYAARLDRVQSRDELLAAIAYLSSIRKALATDADRLRSGLDSLGQDFCRLRAPAIIPAFALPPLHQHKSRKHAGHGHTSATGGSSGNRTDRSKKTIRTGGPTGGGAGGGGG